jgi:large subunit ribosomal protein L23
MAIFDSKKKTTKVEKAKPEKILNNKSTVIFGVVKNPRITEKATFVSEKSNIYTFDVDVSANEKGVKEAIKDLYNVTPLKVNLLPVRGKQVFSRGKLGRRSRGKKAYVYLKAGDKIEFA